MISLASSKSAFRIVNGRSAPRRGLGLSASSRPPKVSLSGRSACFRDVNSEVNSFSSSQTTLTSFKCVRAAPSGAVSGYGGAKFLTHNSLFFCWPMNLHINLAFPGKKASRSGPEIRQRLPTYHLPESRGTITCHECHHATSSSQSLAPYCLPHQRL